MGVDDSVNHQSQDAAFGNSGLDTTPLDAAVTDIQDSSSPMEDVEEGRDIKEQSLEDTAALVSLLPHRSCFH